MSSVADDELIERAGRALLDAAASPARVILFGSYARGDARDGSDLDFLVIESEVNDRAAESVRLRRALRGFGAPVENVDCPKGVKVEVGTEFECTVLYPGGKVAYALLKIRTDEADLNLESLSAHPFLR